MMRARAAALRSARRPQFHAIVAGYEVDFHFPGTPVVLECDGWETHGRNRNQFEFDRVRDAAVTAAGFVIVHFTYRQLARQPERVAKRIRANLDRWAPDLTRLMHRIWGRSRVRA